MNISSPFIHQAMPTNRLMALVCFALIPGIIAQVYFFGYGVIINIGICAIVAVTTEYAILSLRSQKPNTSIKDNSALLTGLLLAVALPPALPFWMSIVGCAFAIIFAKQIYGGLGFNPFNPAMVGYILLLVSFPVEMTAWLPVKAIALDSPSFIESLELIVFNKTSEGQTLDNFRTLADGFTMATPLDHFKTEAMLGKMSSEIWQDPRLENSFLGWMWVNLFYLVGGLYLLVAKVIRWHIPVAVLGSIFILSSALHLYDPQLYSSGWFHLFSGASMIGAFFIATDPVSSATTPKGRIIYGVLIGILIVVIRIFGGYPDAIGFAVLIVNIAVPTIDHYTKPLIYGHKKEVKMDE